MWYPRVVVLLCALILVGCALAFDRLQTRIESMRGAARRSAIALATGVALVAVCAFGSCFVFSAGLLQALGLSLQ